MRTPKTWRGSPSKLQSGEWGANIEGDPQPGDYVRLTSKAGKTWDMLVASVEGTGRYGTRVATSRLAKGEVAPALDEKPAEAKPSAQPKPPVWGDDPKDEPPF